MKNVSYPYGLSRRGFLAGLAPACALFCLGTGKFPARDSMQGNPVQSKSGHKFDQPFNRELSFRQVSDMRYRSLISYAKALEKGIGRDKMLGFLKKDTMARLLLSGQSFAKRAPDTAFTSFTRIFNNPAMAATLEMEVIEDTDEVFEIKVTECLVADTFLRANAGEIGNAAVCIGDYTFAEGFNPNIHMTRDKTLTLGHDCCNHRYFWVD